LSLKDRIIRWCRGLSGSESAAAAIRIRLQQDLEDLRLGLAIHVNASTDELRNAIAELKREISHHLNNQTADLMAHTNHQTADLTAEFQKAIVNQASLDVASPAKWGEQAQRCLFIVGCARSGTTILADSLNLSEDVYLLEEANLFANAMRSDFLSWYNQMHLEVNCRDPRKGLFLTDPGLTSQQPGLEYLRWLLQRYQWAGEKIVFVPTGRLDDRWQQEVFFEFHARYFGLAKYILILRDPVEGVWSMLRLFKTVDPLACFGTWYRTLDTLIDVYCSFKSSWMVIFNRFDATVVQRLAEQLNITVDLPAEMIDSRYVESNLSDKPLPEELSSYVDLAQRARGLFSRVAQAFSPETFRYCGSENTTMFFRDLRNEIRSILEELGQPG